MLKKNNQNLVLFLLTIVLISCINTTQAYTIMGNVNSYEKDGYNITFNCENGKVKLSFLKEDLIRVHMAPAGKDFPKDTLHLDDNGPYAVVTYTWPGVSYQISEGFDPDLEGVVYNIRAGRLLVKVRKQPFKLAFYDTKGNLLVMEKEGIVNAGLGHEDSKVYETMALPDDEHFFGFGAHNHPLDMRGDKIVCSAYRYRTVPQGIRARISKDNGKNWGHEITLRSDAKTWDLGYTRSVQRPDDKIVTIYYYNTEKIPEQHIAATIWDPDQLSQK